MLRLVLLVTVLSCLSAHFAAAQVRLVGLRLESEVMDLPSLADALPPLPAAEEHAPAKQSASFLSLAESQTQDLDADLDSEDTPATASGSTTAVATVSAAGLAQSLAAEVADKSSAAAVTTMSNGMQHLAREIAALQQAIADARASPMPNLVVPGQPALSAPYPGAAVNGGGGFASVPVSVPTEPVRDLDTLDRGPVGRMVANAASAAAAPVTTPLVLGSGAAAPVAIGATGGFASVAAPAPAAVNLDAVLGTASPFSGGERGPMGRLQVRPSPKPLILTFEDIYALLF